MKKIYVTLDTEMDNDIHWGKHYPPEYSSVIEGIPKMLRPIWDKYQVHPIYFVSPEVLYDERCTAVLKEEIRKGAIIGAHLHPEYIQPNSIWGEGIEKEAAKYPCYDYSDDIEEKKLKNLTELIHEKLGVTPVWYRAARFGADEGTVRILHKLGYQYDSSVTPQIDWTSKGGPNHSKAPAKTYRISKYSLQKEARGEIDFSGIIEKPVTIYGKRWGFIGRILPNNWLFYRWLRPTHMTYQELKHIIRKMSKDGLDEGVMMFHSMEVMINKTPYVRTKWMQQYFLWRLDRILRYAKKQEYLF
ncbi:MAG: hypothetical protein K2N34_03015 [Lachnospiraceae bacterium]|nr:hypothetical protein [Lachnospiraceae bacterium]